MPNCAVSGCKNNTRQKPENLKFYSFPKEPELRQKWIVACGESTKLLAKRAFICSTHFEDSYFFITPRERLGFGFKASRNITPDAVPTKNLPLSVTIGQSKSAPSPNRDARTCPKSVGEDEDTECNRSCRSCCLKTLSWKLKVTKLEKEIGRARLMEKTLRLENRDLIRIIGELEEG